VDNQKREGGMTEQELQAIEQRANGATAGPWKAEMGQVLYWSPRPTKAKPNAGYTHTLMRAEQTDYASGEFFAVVDDTDATFIAHARTDVPALVAEVKRLRQDAARWAFIRDSGKLAVNQMRLLDGTNISGGYVGGPYADAAVDAMIARAALGAP
jgi:hypothetical protein